MNHKRNVPVLLLLTLIGFILAACGGSYQGGTVLSVAIVTPVPTDAVVEMPATVATADAMAATTEATATAVVAEATATTVPATAKPSRPQSLVQRSRFPAGATSDVVGGRVGAGQRDVYLTPVRSRPARPEVIHHSSYVVRMKRVRERLRVRRGNVAPVSSHL